jgi:hypothetical protein
MVRGTEIAGLSQILTPLLTEKSDRQPDPNVWLVFLPPSKICLKASLFKLRRLTDAARKCFTQNLSVVIGWGIREYAKDHQMCSGFEQLPVILC